jgi:tetratricopeptide (TPR) repeat protein
VPRRVRDLLSARLERLGKASRHLAAAAAVIGRDFSFALLQRSAGLTPAETAEGIEELVRRRIMSAVGDGFDFTHDRIRRVVSDAVLEPRRRTLHAAVGDALEALHTEHPVPIDDRLAHHYRQAGVVDKALTYLVRVGETARARYALDDALRAFDQALELVDRGPSPAHEPRRVDVLLRKALILSILGRFPDILVLLLPEADRVAALERPDLLGAYHFRVALTHAYLGDQPRAREAALGAIDAARRAGDETVMGQGHYVLALSAYWAGTPGDGVEHARQAIELLAKTSRRDWLGLAYLALGVNLHLRGELDTSLEALGQVEAVGRALADARLLSLAANGRAVVHAERGDWEKAVEAGQCALETSLDPYATASACAVLGIAHLEKGDVEAASACLEAALAEFDRFGHAQPKGRFMALLSETWVKRGRLEHARDVGTRALDISREAGSTWALGLAERVLGRIAVAEGRSDEAAQRLGNALGLFEVIPAPGEVARTHLDLAEVAHARGERDEAARSLHTARELFEALGAPRCVARAVELAARLGIPAA